MMAHQRQGIAPRPLGEKRPTIKRPAVNVEGLANHLGQQRAVRVMLQRMDCVIATPIQLAILFMNMAVQQDMILHQRIQRSL